VQSGGWLPKYAAKIFPCFDVKTLTSRKMRHFFCLNLGKHIARNKFAAFDAQRLSILMAHHFENMEVNAL